MKLHSAGKVHTFILENRIAN